MSDISLVVGETKVSHPEFCRCLDEWMAFVDDRCPYACRARCEGRVFDRFAHSPTVSSLLKASVVRMSTTQLHLSGLRWLPAGIDLGDVDTYRPSISDSFGKRKCAQVSDVRNCTVNGIDSFAASRVTCHALCLAVEHDGARVRQ